MPGNDSIVLQHPGLDCRQRGGGLISVARHHVECHLSIENALGHLLERQQVHGLLVQLVHALLSMFRCGLEDRGHHSLDPPGFLRPQ